MQARVFSRASRIYGTVKYVLYEMYRFTPVKQMAHFIFQAYGVSFTMYLLCVHILANDTSYTKVMQSRVCLNLEFYFCHHF